MYDMPHCWWWWVSRSFVWFMNSTSLPCIMFCPWGPGLVEERLALAPKRPEWPPDVPLLFVPPLTWAAFIIFLYLLLLFWNHIFTCNNSKKLIEHQKLLYTTHQQKGVYLGQLIKVTVNIWSTIKENLVKDELSIQNWNLFQFIFASKLFKKKIHFQNTVLFAFLIIQGHPKFIYNKFTVIFSAPVNLACLCVYVYSTN